LSGRGFTGRRDSAILEIDYILKARSVVEVFQYLDNLFSR
jgi:hypothetical protein